MNMTILFVVTEDWYFCSHRLLLARQLQLAGNRVVVVTRVSEHEQEIKKSGIEVIPLEVNRSGLNPFKDILYLFRLVKIYRKIRPDIIHHVALKPILYGSIAAKLSGMENVVNAFAGMGFLYTGKRSLLKSIIKRLINFSFSRILTSNGFSIIVQNSEDKDFVIKQFHIPPKSVFLIEGSGVDVNEYFYMEEEPESPPILITMVSRILADKGVREFIEALRLLDDEGLGVTGVLVGDPDPLNPSSIPSDEIDSWVSEGVVEWWGYQEDINMVWSRSHISILPSYREGLPKSLIEAAACGKPIIATDIAGCRQLIVDQINGILVPVKDVNQLSLAIKKLAEDKELRKIMGKRNRDLVESRFSIENVYSKTLDLYKTTTL